MPITDPLPIPSGRTGRANLQLSAQLTNDASSDHVVTDPLLKAREASRILCMSEPTFWRHVAQGKLPKPIKLGGLSRWPESEILQVIETAKANREAA